MANYFIPSCNDQQAKTRIRNNVTLLDGLQPNDEIVGPIVDIPAPIMLPRNRRSDTPLRGNTFAQRTQHDQLGLAQNIKAQNTVKRNIFEVSPRIPTIGSPDTPAPKVKRRLIPDAVAHKTVPAGFMTVVDPTKTIDLTLVEVSEADIITHAIIRTIPKKLDGVAVYAANQTYNAEEFSAVYLKMSTTQDLAPTNTLIRDMIFEMIPGSTFKGNDTYMQMSIDELQHYIETLIEYPGSPRQKDGIPLHVYMNKRLFNVPEGGEMGKESDYKNAFVYCAKVDFTEMHMVGKKGYQINEGQIEFKHGRIGQVILKIITNTLSGTTVQYRVQWLDTVETTPVNTDYDVYTEENIGKMIHAFNLHKIIGTPLQPDGKNIEYIPTIFPAGKYPETERWDQRYDFMNAVGGVQDIEMPVGQAFWADLIKPSADILTPEPIPDEDALTEYELLEWTLSSKTILTISQQYPRVMEKDGQFPRWVGAYNDNKSFSEVPVFLWLAQHIFLESLVEVASTEEKHGIAKPGAYHVDRTSGMHPQNRILELENNIDTQSGQLTTAYGDVTDLNVLLTTANGDVTDLTDLLVIANDDVTDLTTQLGTANDLLVTANDQLSGIIDEGFNHSHKHSYNPIMGCMVHNHEAEAERFSVELDAPFNGVWTHPTTLYYDHVHSGPPGFEGNHIKFHNKEQMSKHIWLGISQHIDQPIPDYEQLFKHYKMLSYPTIIAVHDLDPTVYQGPPGFGGDMDPTFVPGVTLNEASYSGHPVNGWSYYVLYMQEDSQFPSDPYNTNNYDSDDQDGVWDGLLLDHRLKNGWIHDQERFAELRQDHLDHSTQQQAAALYSMDLTNSTFYFDVDNFVPRQSREHIRFRVVNILHGQQPDVHILTYPEMMQGVFNMYANKYCPSPSEFILNHNKSFDRTNLINRIPISSHQELNL
jgi:hypothetical protein